MVIAIKSFPRESLWRNLHEKILRHSFVHHFFSFITITRNYFPITFYANFGKKNQPTGIGLSFLPSLVRQNSHLRSLPVVGGLQLSS